MKYVFFFLKEPKTNRLAFILFILGISFIIIGIILMTTVKYEYDTNNELQNEYAGMSKTYFVFSLFFYQKHLRRI